MKNSALSAKGLAGPMQGSTAAPNGASAAAVPKAGSPPDQTDTPDQAGTPVAAGDAAPDIKADAATATAAKVGGTPDQAGRPVPTADVALGPKVGVAAAAVPKAGSAKATVDAGSAESEETLDERDERRILELAKQLKSVRRRRHRRLANGQKVLLKKSTSEMKDYLGNLPPGAKFTIDVLIRVGVKAEELGLSPADLFAKLGEVALSKQK